MAKQPSSQTYNVPIESQTAQGARGIFGLGLTSRLDAATCAMIAVSVVTAYLVLPPLYSVIQTSLLPPATGEIDNLR